VVAHRVRGLSTRLVAAARASTQYIDNSTELPGTATQSSIPDPTVHGEQNVSKLHPEEIAVIALHQEEEAVCDLRSRITERRGEMNSQDGEAGAELRDRWVASALAVRLY
jgi:hypothetical protein